jgi:hypothetical protein
MKTYLDARAAAGTAKGIEYAKRLAALPPNEAADEISDMFVFCADEDLACDISCDLELDLAAAERIAVEIVRQRRGRPLYGPGRLAGDDEPDSEPEGDRGFGPRKE